MTRARGRRTRFLRSCVGPVATLLVLAACTGGEDEGAATGAGLQVITSAYPLEFVVTEVGGPAVDVRNLTAAGADSHATELTPQQVVSLGEADLVVHLSGMQAGVDDALTVQPPEHLLDAAPLADRDGDPHFWLDPARMSTLAGWVADELAGLDAAGAQEYRAAADRLRGELDALAVEYDEVLSDCDGAALVTAHEAFGYLADAYGLEQVGVAGIDPHVAPSPARVRDVAEVIQDRDVRTVFFEAAAGPGLARALAADLGTTTAVLHPIERVEQGRTYPDLMRANLAALRDGLTCRAT